MTNVFISWSGETSREIAEELRNWIPSVLQFAKPYYTPSDVEKGAKWASEISSKLAESNVGIICLTKENHTKPWILFEAGALSKDLEASKVCSILFGMDNTDLSGPLTTFQTTQFGKADFKKLMQSINASGGDAKLEAETFNRVFDMWWPQLEEKINSIMSKRDVSSDTEVRTDREILEEILALSRTRLRSMSSRERRVPEGLISEMLELIEIVQVNNQESKGPSMRINEALEEQLKAIEYLTEMNGYGMDFHERIARLGSMIQNFVPF